MRHSVTVVRSGRTGARALLLKAAAAAFAVGIAFPMPASARPAPTYDLVLTAKVRDFPATHPDFCKPTTIGQNWVEGSVAPTLNAQGKPVYTGQGKRVTVPANDAQGRPIANSHINSTVLIDPLDLKLVGAPTYANSPSIDTYNPNLGPYGGSNVGPAPEIGTGQTMPTVIVPNITPVVATYTQQGSGTSVTLNSNFRCTDFVVKDYAKVTVQGNVTIVVDSLLMISNFAKIELAAGARLTIYAKKDVYFQDSVVVNMNTNDSTRFVLYKTGVEDVVIQNSAKVCGTFVIPQGRFYMHNQAEFFGNVTSKDMHLQNTAKLHVPEPLQTSCNIINDTPAQLGALSAGAVTNAGTFDQWFNTSSGTNMEAQARLVFQKQSDGALQFSSDDFRPIDGQLLDEGGYGANRNFTMEMDGEFTYTPCAGQFFQFQGDGDAYVYIDGKLVLEMAGNNSGVTQFVDMSRLGLDPGQKHRLQFFYAQRSCSASKFKVRTNVELETKYTVETETVAIMD